ncbi:putative halogenase [Lyophyllum atratum]|nr:putative halogenase [Lyophyllum atratum]
MSAISNIPTSTQVLVIGGGPAGSYAATVLAREGFDVTLLEKDFFPRYHIGESMLPSCRSFLQFVDAEEKVKKHGFAKKPGAAVKLHQHKREGYTDFVAINPENGAWNVIRSEFDEILLRHAASCGVKVHEGVRVTALEFEGGDAAASIPVESRKIKSASWSNDSTSGTISFDWIVDASGRNGIVSTKYLKNRTFNTALRNVAAWGYWTGGSVYMPGTTRENAPWFEALTDESGWAWFIPLHDGTTSVGIVQSEHTSREKRARLRETMPSENVTKALYLEEIALAPGMQKMLKGAKLKSKDIKQAGDYSYSATAYAGANWRLAGDAGAFIDPFFSSGVHLAFAGGLSAATSIASSIRGECSVEDSANFHNLKVGTAYTRFMLVVLSVYRQIRAQESVALSDITEDNFDRAFDIWRPIIQGKSDVDPTVTQQEILDTMDFCKNVVAPIQPEMVEAVKKRFPLLFAEDAPTLSEEKLDTLTEVDGTPLDEDTRNVLLRNSARKITNTLYDGTRHFGSEVLGGFYVNLVRGHLGLIRASM